MTQSHATPAPDALLRQTMVFINDDSALATYCKQWMSCRLLAIDTEFMRVDTYYPIAALIQINDGTANYIIDPLKITEWQPLADVLTSNSVVKALHACSEDLDVFHTLLNVLPRKLFDTQIAAALLGIGASIGYANLVNDCLDVELPKGETRSDWLARPLRDAQILYAALDVDYLYELATVLEARLNDKARESWVYEESQAAIDNFIANGDPASGFYKSNNTWRLNPEDLTIAKALFEWREATARQRNIPRTRILKDAQLFDVVNRKPSALAQLKLLGLHDSAIRKFGKDILALLIPAEGAAQAKIKSSQRPLSKPQRERAKAIKDTVQAIAKRHEIAPEILARKAEYHAMVRAIAQDTSDIDALKSSASGWRKQFFESLSL
ncbi:MAG TPA: ribonuclease D [Marinagarivorans sp.]